MPQVKKSVATKKKSTAVSKTTSAKIQVKKVAKPATKKVSFLPKGYTCVTPYLIVNNGHKAIAFYQKVFAAKELMRMDRPDGKLGHTELKIGDSKIMLADSCPQSGALNPKEVGGTPVSIHLYVKDVDAVVNAAVKAGAKLIRNVEDMFYGDRSGGIIDPFGHNWYISTHIEDVTPAKMKKRAAELFNKK